MPLHHIWYNDNNKTECELYCFALIAYSSLESHMLRMAMVTVIHSIFIQIDMLSLFHVSIYNSMLIYPCTTF